MLKYYRNILRKVLLISLTNVVFFSLHTYAANTERNNYEGLDLQLGLNTFTSNSSDDPSSESMNKGKRARTDHIVYLSLTLPLAKINLILQKEKELKNNYSGSAVFPKQCGHHWEFDELSDQDAKNLCHTLWSGFKFSEVDGVDRSHVLPNLYPFCKIKKIPLKDTRPTGYSSFCYNIAYPHSGTSLKIKHRISVLQCFCRYTHMPHNKYISNNSNRSFFAHKFKDNEYLILAPIHKERYKYHDLKIIDVQEVNLATVLLDSSMSTPIYTNQ